MNDAYERILPGGEERRLAVMAAAAVALIGISAWLWLAVRPAAPTDGSNQASAKGPSNDLGNRANPTLPPIPTPTQVASDPIAAPVLAAATAAAAAGTGSNGQRLAQAQRLEDIGYVESAWAAYAAVAGVTDVSAVSNTGTVSTTSAANKSNVAQPRLAQSSPLPGSASGADAETLAAAAVALARLALAKQDHATAKAALERVTEAGGVDALPAPGRYLYGEVLLGEGRYEEAMAAYDSYGRAAPAMIDVAQMAVGNAAFAAGDFRRALAAFTIARDQAADPGGVFLAHLRRGNALLRLGTGPAGPADTAAAAYDAAYRAAEDDTQRSQALAGLVAVHGQADDTAKANLVRHRLVHELPQTDLAARALANLKAAGQAVDAGDEAAVSAGQGDRWAALAILDAAVRAKPDHPSAWRLEILRQYTALGEHRQVLQNAGRFLAERPDDPLAAEVAWSRAGALVKLGRAGEAAEGYRSLAERWPQSERAPAAVWQQAALTEDTEGALAAAKVYDSLAHRFPQSPEAPDAQFRAGFLDWRSGALPAAAERWSALADHSTGSQLARVAYWLGRAAADTGALESATPYWRRAVAADPSGYYGLRAADRLGLPAAGSNGSKGSAGSNQGTASAASNQGHASSNSSKVDTSATSGPSDAPADLDSFDLDQPLTDDVRGEEIRRWLAAVYGRPSAAEWADLRRSIEHGRSVERAAAWLAIGQRGAALRTLRQANAGLGADPPARAALALAAYRLGVYEVASSAASQVLAGAGTSASESAPASGSASASASGSTSASTSPPAALGQLAYPDPSIWHELVGRAAAEYGVAPSLLLAVIRQESRFEPTARSSAGATGLAQVMPATGQRIAEQLDMPDFSGQDLLQPYLSIRMGAYYLGQKLHDFDSHDWAALAAYNGGPGNARRWWAAADGDRDVFAEQIDYRETRKYMRAVLEHQAQYRRWYPGLDDETRVGNR